MSTNLNDNYLKGYGWALTPLMVISCFAQVGVASALFKLPTRVPWAAFLMLFFYGYTNFSAMVANRDLGRSMALPIGWHTWCLVWYPAMLVSVMQGIYCTEKYRDVVKWSIIVVCVLSGLLGLAQNFNLGPARSILYSIEGQTDGVFRPTGLTNYPSQLGFQGMIGMVILGSSIFFRNLKWWEWLGVSFFGLVTLSAQYRSMYYAGLALCIVALVVLVWHRDRAQSVLIVLISCALVALPLIIAPNRFVYGMKGTQNDAALQARQLAWKQAEPAIRNSPLTGIGPDYSLILATGPQAGGDRWSTNVLDNIYMTIRVCYGWVGIGLASLFIALTLGGLAMKVALAQPVVASAGIAGIIATISVLTFSLSGNSIVYTTVGCNMAALLALCATSWREELQLQLVSDQVVRVRRIANRMMRRVGINVG